PYHVDRYHVGDGPVDPTNPTYQPYAVTISPTDGSVWVSCLKSGDVRVFLPASKTWDATRGPVATGGVPFFGEFKSDGSVLYMPNQASNTLVLIDPATGEVTQTLGLPTEACTSPHGLFLTPDERRLLIVCEGDHTSPGTVAIVNVSIPTPAVDAYHTVGVFPD